MGESSAATGGDYGGLNIDKKDVNGVTSRNNYDKIRHVSMTIEP